MIRKGLEMTGMVEAKLEPEDSLEDLVVDL